MNIDRILRFRLCSVNDYGAVPLTVMSPTNCAVLLVALDRPPCRSPQIAPLPHEWRSRHGGWPNDCVRKVSCGCVTEAPPIYSSRLCKARPRMHKNIKAHGLLYMKVSHRAGRASLSPRGIILCFVEAHDREIEWCVDMGDGCKRCRWGQLWCAERP